MPKKINKDSKKIDINIKLNKKDTNELFTGKYKIQVFADKKDKLEKINKKDKQKKYNDDNSDII